MMPPERWQQVSQIFEAAVALEPDARAAYVKAHCGADEALRSEVESLIQSHQKAQQANFIEEHAVERAASLLVVNETEAEGEKPRLEDGQEVGRYRVIRKIGAGGMGEIYLARDMQLDRTVALKILPADVSADQSRMMRFKQEARSVSALNQPNILTIFEFGETDAIHFIATEYIDGETLRRYLRGKQIKLLEIIDIGIQLAAALDAAHEATIMHRDIKPENIMIRRRDGLVKVLDFGLAKLTEKGAAPGEATDTEAATEVLLKTKPGSVLGTVNYMSPEQAQGLLVDERTDIWSMGVVLYEMVAGHTPFSGPTVSHTVVEILEKEPVALTEVPAELERIVRKALAKKPDERYQTAKDLLIDLKNLRKRLEVEAEIERSAAPSFVGSALRTDENLQVTDQHQEARKTPTVPSPADRRLSVAPRRKTVLIALLTIIVVAGALFIASRAWRSSRSTVGNSASASVPANLPVRQLSYWITVQKYRDGRPFEEPFRLAHEINFEKDYRVRLNVGSSQPGYLYILNEGPATGEATSSYVVLFPSPTANGGSAFVSENREIQIPEQSWIAFDAEQGTEKLWLVFSANTIPELERIKRFANPQDQGLVKDADLNDMVNRFLRANSPTTPAIERNDEQNVTNLKVAGDVLIQVIRLEHH